MPLDWNAQDVEAFESFSDEEKQRCALFAYELMAIDIGTVHEDNTEEIYLRLEIWDRLHGGRSKYTYEDVLSYVGFRTNVYTLPRRQWLERRVDQLESDLRIITRPEPEPVGRPDWAQNTFHYVGD